MLFQATVLLTVNISYIAISNIESSSRIASLCSTVFSIGRIIIGLLLVSEDHTDPKSNGYAVSAMVSYRLSFLLNILFQSYSYFKNLESMKFGYEPLSILYSLPFSLFMWR